MVESTANATRNLERLVKLEMHCETIVESIKRIEEKMESMEVIIREHEKFQNKIHGFIWLGGSVVSGALFFVWEGVKLLIGKFHS